MQVTENNEISSIEKSTTNLDLGLELDLGLWLIFLYYLESEEAIILPNSIIVACASGVTNVKFQKHSNTFYLLLWH